MRRAAACWIACALSAGCAPATGDVTVLLEAEGSITEGIDAGSSEEDIVDGWSVRFSKYVVAIGAVRLARTAAELEVRADEVAVIDLATLPAGGVELARFEALEVGRWDRFEYATPSPEGATRDASVDPADFDAMVANGWTHWIEGTIESDAGESCAPDGSCRPASRLAFRFAASVPTMLGPCQAEDGLPGVTVTEGGTTVSITLHGDHVFFDAFPAGAEVIARRAQWLANADLDGDDVITPDELMAIDAAALFPLATHHLAGGPAEIPIDTGWDFVRAQLATQGHFQGEGECPWDVAP